MYKITNQSPDNTEILLYSLIDGGYTAGRIIKALQASQSENITLRINSDGGDVFDSIALYNYLKAHNVHVIIDGICASGASIIAMSGRRVTMKQGSMMMIHNPVSIAAGESEDLRAQADVLDKVTDAIAGIYAAKTGMPQAEVLDLMKAETWMNEFEAQELGFVDDIDTPAPAPASQAVEVSDRYDEGVQAERKRLRELDELYTPERGDFLNEAKYITHKSASEIAIELLKREKVRAQPEVNNFRAEPSFTGELENIGRIIARKRGMHYA